MHLVSRTWVAAGAAAVGFSLAACWGGLDCEEADQQAERLLAEYGSCAAGESCRSLYLNEHVQSANELGTCIDAFVCSVALRENADQQAFIRRARDLVSRRRCNTCTVAKCQLPESLQAFCDPETKRCKLR